MVRLCTAPRGDDLRLKSFFNMAKGDEAMAVGDGFADAMEAQFKKVAPLMRFIAEAQGVGF